jgi:hypothetical protein
MRSDQATVEQKILREAGRPRGVTFHELRDRCDISTSVSRTYCRRLADEGRLHSVRAMHGHGLRWFAKKDDAKAFGSQQARPRAIEHFPTKPVQLGLSTGLDSRYQCGPEFKGGLFTSLGIGRYVE